MTLREFEIKKIEKAVAKFMEWVSRATKIENTTMNDETKIQLLKDEYLHLQNVVESFDGRALTIKACGKEDIL